MTVLLVLGGLGLLVLVLGLALGEVLDGALEVALPGDLGTGVTAAAGAGLAALGLGGALVLSSTALPLAAAVGLGALGGLAVGTASFHAARAVIGTSAEPARSSDLFGLFGTVVSAVPAGGYGAVSLVSGGTRLKLTARAEVALPAGAAVYVLEVLSDTAVVVAPIDPTHRLPPAPPREGSP